MVRRISVLKLPGGLSWGHDSGIAFLKPLCVLRCPFLIVSICFAAFCHFSPSLFPNPYLSDLRCKKKKKFLLSWIIRASIRLIWGLSLPHSQSFIFEYAQLQAINHIILFSKPVQWVEYFWVGQGQLWDDLSLKKKRKDDKIKEARHRETVPKRKCLLLICNILHFWMNWNNISLKIKLFLCISPSCLCHNK